MTRPCLTFVINHAAFFVSHRLPLAVGAMQQGFSVSLLSGQAGNEQMELSASAELGNYPIDHYRVSFRSSSVNPVLECFGILQLFIKLLRLKPDIMHCASPKGVLYGGISARLAGVPCLVLAVSGMGYAFTSSIKPSVRRKIIGFIYRLLARFAFAHKNLRVIVQNHDDFRSMVASGWIDETAIKLIPGSGVDLSLFPYDPYVVREKIVLFPARVLYDKGILEFIEAARFVREHNKSWKFVIAGAAGYDNPSAVSRSMLDKWVDEGIVEWLGHAENMPEIFMNSSIVCLPSYREGMPKSLLEAAAAGCAIVTTDVVGCREAIEPGVTGDLVPAKDPKRLGAVLLSLIVDESRRRDYGNNGRRRAEQFFALESVVAATMDIYQELIEHAKQPS